MKKILVIGSVNMDMVIGCDRLPALGETIDGFGWAQIPGGKGANQAISAARLGAAVKMIGCLGADETGRSLLENLKNNGVDIQGIRTVGSNSGIAVITVCRGDNHIILDHGANYKMTRDLIDPALIKWADMVLLQLEIPVDVVVHAAKTARQNGVTVLLNPAPVENILPEMLDYTDILVVNRHEAGHMLNMEITTLEQQETAVRLLMEKGIRQIVITLGAEGSVYNDGNEIKRQKSYKTTVADTTGAGDSFIGGFCAAMDALPLVQAVSYASAVAAITVSRKGACTSLPYKEEADEFYNSFLNRD